MIADKTWKNCMVQLKPLLDKLKYSEKPCVFLFFFNKKVNRRNDRRINSVKGVVNNKSHVMSCHLTSFLRVNITAYIKVLDIVEGCICSCKALLCFTWLTWPRNNWMIIYFMIFWPPRFLIWITWAITFEWG